MPKLFFFIFILFSACKSEQAASGDAELPNTPEEVARAWQKYIDVNEFDKAKKLSTPAAILVIESIQSIMLGEEDSLEIMHTEFVTMTCKETADDAVCYYVLHEEGERFRDSFILKKINGQWLVDIVEDTTTPEEEIFENTDGAADSTGFDI